MTATAILEKTDRVSRVLEAQPADPVMAHSHFASKLSVETDPSDVYADMKNGASGVIVVDARTPEAYARGHVQGSINLPHRQIDAVSTLSLPKDKVLVTYCEGVFCNASTKAAVKLTALGFKVKEMIGGLDGWKHEGYDIEAGTPPIGIEKSEK